MAEKEIACSGSSKRSNSTVRTHHICSMRNGTDNCRVAVLARTSPPRSIIFQHPCLAAPHAYNTVVTPNMSGWNTGGSWAAKSAAPKGNKRHQQLTPHRATAFTTVLKETRSAEILSRAFDENNPSKEAPRLSWHGCKQEGALRRDRIYTSTEHAAERNINSVRFPRARREKTNREDATPKSC